MVKSIKTLMPNYVKEFQCIGTRCEDTCCQKWSIDVDKKTYLKYRNTKDKELSENINKFVKRNRINASTESYARIKLNDFEKCPFLSNESLCGVQLNHGIEYLSKLCISYPRGCNIVDEVLERTLFMSCPEAARMVLLNPKMIEFDEMEDPSDNINIVNVNIDTKTKDTNIIVNYFWQLRIFTIEVIQNRMYSVEERLLILGMFYSKLQEKLNNNSDISNLINSFKPMIADGTFRSMLKKNTRKFCASNGTNKRIHG